MGESYNIQFNLRQAQRNLAGCAAISPDQDLSSSVSTRSFVISGGAALKTNELWTFIIINK